MRLVEYAVRTRVRFLRRGQKPPPPAESAALGRVSAHHNKQGKALPLCPARKLGFRRWGKHSAWLSAPHFPAPGGGFAGRSPHPLPLRNVRFAQNALREWAFLAPLSCSSASNGTRFPGLPFERKPEKEEG